MRRLNFQRGFGQHLFSKHIILFLNHKTFIMGWINDIFHTRSKDWLYARIPDAAAPQVAPSREIVSGSEYLNVTLRSMRIVNLRNGLSKFYPTVYSYIQVPHLGGKRSHFNVVTTPGGLVKLDANNIDRVLQINKRLVGPVPYQGGDVKMEVGLFSIKEADLAEPFLKLLTDISDMSGVAFASAALPYVKPLTDGINLLTGGSGNAVLEIGIDQEMDVIRSGAYVVMRAEKNKVEINKLRLSQFDFKLTNEIGQNISDYPYMVIEISGQKTRDDWFLIPNISEAYNKIMSAAEQGNYTEAGEALKAFKSTVRFSKDLLADDKKRLTDKAVAEVDGLLTATPTAGTFLAMKPLAELDLYD
jgi:hypothetical protein